MADFNVTERAAIPLRMAHPVQDWDQRCSTLDRSTSHGVGVQRDDRETGRIFYAS